MGISSLIHTLNFFLSHPYLFSSHIVPNNSFFQSFQFPQSHVFGNRCSRHDMTILPQAVLNYDISIFTTTPTLSKRTSVHILSTKITAHIILMIQCSTPRYLVPSATVSSNISQQCNKTGLTQH